MPQDVFTDAIGRHFRRAIGVEMHDRTVREAAVDSMLGIAAHHCDDDRLADALRQSPQLGWLRDEAARHAASLAGRGSGERATNRLLYPATKSEHVALLCVCEFAGFISIASAHDKTDSDFEITDDDFVKVNVMVNTWACDKSSRNGMVSVPRLCHQTVVCIGSGPSLTRDDVASCEGHAAVIAVNDAVFWAPFAVALMASDAAWWAVHRGVPAFRGLKYCLDPAARGRWPDVQVLQKTGRDGVELKPTGLRSGASSGAAAINLAVHFGASRILLLGYDCGPAEDGREHFFGSHPPKLRNDSPYALFRERFAAMVEPLNALGVSVVNCSRETNLTCFPRMDLADALAVCRDAAA